MFASGIEFQAPTFSPSTTDQEADYHIPCARSQMCEDLRAIEREIESTMRKCEQFRSAEVAWRDAMGPGKLSTLVFQHEDLTEKLQAAEQDLLDISENHQTAVQRVQDAIEKRLAAEEHVAVCISARRLEVNTLRQQEAAAENTASQIKAAEKGLSKSNMHLQAELTRPLPGSELRLALPQSRGEAYHRVRVARSAAAKASHIATKAEAALLQARRDLLHKAAPAEQPEIGKSTDGNKSKPDEKSTRASLWRSLCEKSQTRATMCETKAAQTSVRLEAAERCAEQSRETCEELEQSTRATIAEIDALKLDNSSAAKQSQWICGTTFLLVCLTLVQLMSGLPSLQLLKVGREDATTYICFVAGAILVRMHLAWSSSQRQHVPVKTASKCLADLYATSSRTGTWQAPLSTASKCLGDPSATSS